MKKTISRLEIISKGYGISYLEENSFRAVAYPIPLNIFIKYLRKLWVWLKVGHIYPKHIERLLTLKEASEILNVNPETLRRWDNQGKLKAIKINSRKDRRYKMSDIRKFT